MLILNSNLFNISEVRRCISCGQLREVFDFNKASRKICKSCYNARQLYTRKVNPFRRLVSTKKYESKIKNIPFDLDEEYLKGIWTGICPVLGEDIQLATGVSTSAQLDRVVPGMGYTKGNVCFLSPRINRIKTDATIAELEMILKFLKDRRDLEKE